MNDLDPIMMHSVGHCPPWIVQILEVVQTVSDLVGMTAITIALVVSAVRWIVAEARLLRGGQWTHRWRALGGIRMFLGNYILFGLEFMIVSDLIHSFLKPDLDSLTQLGAIVFIRTLIGYFLGKEIEAVRNEESVTQPQSA